MGVSYDVKYYDYRYTDSVWNGIMSSSLDLMDAATTILFLPGIYWNDELNNICGS